MERGHPSYLEILRLRPSFSEEDAHRAFREAAKTAHPDRGGDPKAFIELQQAYERALASLAHQIPPQIGAEARRKPSRAAANINLLLLRYPRPVQNSSLLFGVLEGVAAAALIAFTIWWLLQPKTSSREAQPVAADEQRLERRTEISMAESRRLQADNSPPRTEPAAARNLVQHDAAQPEQNEVARTPPPAAELNFELDIEEELPSDAFDSSDSAASLGDYLAKPGAFASDTASGDLLDALDSLESGATHAEVDNNNLLSAWVSVPGRDKGANSSVVVPPAPTYRSGVNRPPANLQSTEGLGFRIGPHRAWQYDDRGLSRYSSTFTRRTLIPEPRSGGDRAFDALFPWRGRMSLSPSGELWQSRMIDRLGTFSRFRNRTAKPSGSDSLNSYGPGYWDSLGTGTATGFDEADW
jgi:hypothetical protein